MKDPTKDLADRLALLNIRHQVAFASLGTPATRAQLTDLAEVLEAALRADTMGTIDQREQAVSRVRAIVDPSDLDDRDRATSFWATPLGRLLFAAGGYGQNTLSQSQAAGVLGCSRQWVHELVTAGRFTRIPSLPVQVLTMEVQELLKARLDKLVN